MTTFQDFMNLCEKRRSIRYFSTEPVDIADIRELLEAAHLAPNVENTQPWHFHIVTNPDLRAKLMEASCYGNFVAGAGAFIIITCDKTAAPKTREMVWNPKELEYSCVSAIDHFILAATAKGLGTCWVSLHHGPVHDMLKLKDHHVIIGGIILGMLRDDEDKQSSRHERKDVKEMYTLYE